MIFRDKRKKKIIFIVTILIFVTILRSNEFVTALNTEIETNIYVDGDLSDWQGIEPLFNFSESNNNFPDIKSIYIANNNTHIIIRADFFTEDSQYINITIRNELNESYLIQPVTMDDFNEIWIYEPDNYNSPQASNLISTTNTKIITSENKKSFEFAVSMDTMNIINGSRIDIITWYGWPNISNEPVFANIVEDYLPTYFSNPKQLVSSNGFIVGILLLSLILVYFKRKSYN